jgi:hypothetical protein
VRWQQGASNKCTKEICSPHCTPNMPTVVNLRISWCSDHVIRMAEFRNTYKIFVRIPESKDHLDGMHVFLWARYSQWTYGFRDIQRIPWHSERHWTVLKKDVLLAINWCWGLTVFLQSRIFRKVAVVLTLTERLVLYRCVACLLGHFCYSVNWALNKYMVAVMHS